jgi:predicted transcriptional regulator
MDNNIIEMNIETLQTKVTNQSRLIKELTTENEEFYHQYNHLIIRNGKLLKRIDDLQRIIDDLHVRIEELQLINGNMMQLNDRLRNRGEGSASENLPPSSSSASTEKFDEEFDIEDICTRWKNYPGQIAQNGPNIRKQVQMLIHLYSTPSLRAGDLFSLTGIGGVTGARYVSALKKFQLIEYTGARKKGHYKITSKGRSFVDLGALNALKANTRQVLLEEDLIK